jgi:predicted nucleic acid-binding protein
MNNYGGAMKILTKEDNKELARLIKQYKINLVKSTTLITELEKSIKYHNKQNKGGTNA